VSVYKDWQWSEPIGQLFTSMSNVLNENEIFQVGILYDANLVFMHIRIHVEHPLVRVRNIKRSGWSARVSNGVREARHFIQAKKADGPAQRPQ
jgi:hypothetical protein